MRDWLNEKSIVIGTWVIILGAVTFSAAPIVY